MNFFDVTCNFKGNSFQKIFRLIKAITYSSSVEQTPGPLISVLADKVKLTQCNKHINKRHAITNLFCSNKGTEKRCLLQFFTEKDQSFADAFPLCCL